MLHSEIPSASGQVKTRQTWPEDSSWGAYSR